MSEIRVENIIGETGLDAVKFTKGVNVTGVVTATSFTGSVAASQLTGALPAISGANLTGVSAGKVLQVVSTTKTDTASNSTGSQNWWSYTDSSLRVTITPTHANNKILITGTITIGVDSLQWIFIRLEKNGSRLNAGNGNQDGNKSRCFTATHHADDAEMPHTNKVLNYLDTAGDTNSRYYNFGIAHTSGATRALYINRGNRTTNDFYTPACASTITAMEIEV
tara:strand:- start:341 stop:1009 length:669 start_codon:yes stop_codon:yes gene_type:complete